MGYFPVSLTKRGVAKLRRDTMEESINSYEVQSDVFLDSRHGVRHMFVAVNMNFPVRRWRKGQTRNSLDF